MAAGGTGTAQDGFVGEQGQVYWCLRLFVLDSVVGWESLRNFILFKFRVFVRPNPAADLKTIQGSAFPCLRDRDMGHREFLGIRTRDRSLLETAPAADQVEDQNDDGDDDQDVDEASADVEAEAQQPKNQQNYYDCPEHS